jgi:hypothetical protein
VLDLGPVLVALLTVAWQAEQLSFQDLCTTGFGSLDGSLDFNAGSFTVDLTGSITMESP